MIVNVLINVAWDQGRRIHGSLVHIGIINGKLQGGARCGVAGAFRRGISVIVLFQTPPPDFPPPAPAAPRSPTAPAPPLATAPPPIPAPRQSAGCAWPGRRGARRRGGWFDPGRRIAPTLLGELHLLSVRIIIKPKLPPGRGEPIGVCYRWEYCYCTTTGEEPRWTPKLYSFVASVMIC
jgi:hypothetical protein